MGMRCDLHVHTRHSGMCTIPLLNRVSRESYSDPEAVYQTLKRRGMDLVTVTDHDSIDAAEQLRRYPDFFLSEEVTCITPSGTEIHTGSCGSRGGLRQSCRPIIATPCSSVETESARTFARMGVNEMKNPLREAGIEQTFGVVEHFPPCDCAYA